MEQPLTELFRHNRWANLRLLDFCAGLPEGLLDGTAPGTYGRVRDTLVHIFAAEEGYVAGLTGEVPERMLRDLAAFPGFDELRERARRSGEALVRLADETPAGRMCRGTTRQGQPFAVDAAVFLVQAINHATEHRAHVVTILSGQGADPPVLDVWVYGDEQGAVQIGS